MHSLVFPLLRVVLQRSSTKAFLGHLEATTGLDFDGDGQVVFALHARFLDTRTSAGASSCTCMPPDARRPRTLVVSTQVAGGSGGVSSRPPSAIQKPFSRAGSVSGSDGIRSGKASPANACSKASSGRTSSPQSQQMGDSGNMFSNLAAGTKTDKLKKLQVCWCTQSTQIVRVSHQR